MLNGLAYTYNVVSTINVNFDGSSCCTCGPISRAKYIVNSLCMSLEIVNSFSRSARIDYFVSFFKGV